MRFVGIAFAFALAVHMCTATCPLQSGATFPGGVALGSYSADACNATTTMNGGILGVDENGRLSLCTDNVTKAVVSVEDLQEQQQELDEVQSTLADHTTKLDQILTLLQSLQAGGGGGSGLTNENLQHHVFCAGRGVYDSNEKTCTCYSDPVEGYYVGSGCGECLPGLGRDVTGKCNVDVEPPTVTVIGASHIYIPQFSAYVDQGVTITDNAPINVTEALEVSGSVDTNTVGTYLIIYTVTDAIGLVTIRNRTVEVYSHLGDGAEGSVTVDASVQVVNTYTSLLTSVSAGSVQLPVASPSGFSAGDEVMIHQSQGTGAGTYEFSRVSIAGGSVIELAYELQNSYSTSGTYDHVQVVRVPNYETLEVTPTGTVTASSWDGSVGGILAFRAQRVLLNGHISGDTNGYRGGQVGTQTCHYCGWTGESYARTSTQLNSVANAEGGGGSGFCSCGESSGAGAHATSGDPFYESPYASNACNGNPNGNSGSTYGVSDLATMFFGSGSGGGCADDTGCRKSRGRNGGGIVYIGSGAVLIGRSGMISANGEDSNAYASGSCDDTHGASGAGGSVFLRTNDLVIVDTDMAGHVQARGGARSMIDQSNSFTARGGEGRVRVDFDRVNGNAFGSTEATTDLQTICDPQPGHVFNLPLSAVYNSSHVSDVTSGASGSSLTISSSGGHNQYLAVHLASATEIQIVGPTSGVTGLSRGDLIVLHQSQNPSSGVAGTWEMARVAHVAPHAILLMSPLGGSYQPTAQLVTVPYHSSITVNSGVQVSPPGWNGAYGGIIAMAASSINVQGTVHANQLGFRGPGRVQGSCHNCGYTGESWNAGSSIVNSIANNEGGGGTSYCSCGEAAGAGGYGTAGFLPSTSVGCSSQPHGTRGSSYGDANLAKIFFGSSGGGGCRDDTGCEYTDGGNGGGIVVILADTLQIDGAVTSTGEDATGGDSETCDDTMGGAGAGGAVYLSADSFSGSGSMSVSGGNPTFITQGSTTTGRGGEGRIRVDVGGVDTRGANLQCGALSFASCTEHSHVGSNF